VTLPAIELDPTFGTGGRVVLDALASARDYDAILQRDGKLVVVGVTPAAGATFNSTSADPSRDVLVARFNPDGTLDATFGGDGIVTFDFNDSDDRGYSIAEQVDGKLVVVGAAQGVDLDVDGAVARLNPDGSLDTSFHGNGLAVLPLAGTQELFGIAIQNDGKILVGGYDSTMPARFSPQTFAVARLLADGTLDTAYRGSAAGIAILPPEAGVVARISGLALQADGKLVAVGSRFVSSPDQYQQVAALRLDAEGALDPTFGTGGVALVEHNPDYFQEQARRVVVQPDQSLLLVGTNVLSSGDKLLEGAVLRLGTNGGPDASFGVNGWARGVNGVNSDTGQAIVLEASGHTLTAGATARGGEESLEDFAMSRLMPSGELDATFGTQGRLTVDFSEPGTPLSSRSNAILLQASGRIVVVGSRGTLVQTQGLDPATQQIVIAGLCRPVVQFAEGVRTVSESATVVNLIVRRTCGSVTGPVTVHYATNAGTASAGTDFTAANGTLTWAAGEADEKTLAIQLPGDTNDEADEQFTVVLSAPGSASLGATTTATITITDDDEAPPPPGNGGGTGSGDGGSGGSNGGGANAGGGGGGGGSLDFAVLIALLAAGTLSATGRRRTRPLA